MSDTEFSVAEKLRAIQIAHEQMLVAIISTICDMRPQDDAVRLAIANRSRISYRATNSPTSATRLKPKRSRCTCWTSDRN